MPSVGIPTLAAGTISTKTAGNVVDVMDTSYIDASSTNITASTGVPVTIVAALDAAAIQVQCMDTTGEYIGLYSDPAGTPVLECIFGPGCDQTIDIQIPPATVLGIRNMKNAAITVGDFALNFIG